ncbi:MAG: glycoside-pentoside-hexuronide (GPH):cation symporter [Proteobacteria bacterium]|nr:glycoside-pentoside-hexuronide (GPH):cation symporter [Pseudomonadota bacterium]
MTEARAELPDRVPLGSILVYALPGLGTGFIFFLASIYLLKYATDVLLLSPAVMGLLFGASRVWDAISDPMAGSLSDRTQSTMGRRRSWLLLAAVPIAVTSVLLWAPPRYLEGTALALWMGFFLFAHYTATTMYAVPHESLGAELTRNHHERTRVFGVRHVVHTFGIFLAVGGLALLNSSDDPRTTARDLMLAAGALTIVLSCIAVWRLREPSEHQGRGGRSVLGGVRDVLRNPHARILLIVFAIETIGTSTLAALVPYVMQYVVMRTDLTPLVLSLFLGPAILFVPVWIVVSRRVGKKRLWAISMAAMAVAFSGLFFIGPGDIVPIAVLACIAGIGSGLGNVVGPSIQADIIDYDEYQTGERKEGAYFALWNFVRKSGTGLTLALTGFMLEISGFVPNVEQSEETKLALRALVGLFPGGCYVIGTLLFLRFRFTQDEHARVQEELLARRDPRA